MFLVRFTVTVMGTDKQSRLHRMADDIFRRCGRSESERQNTACKQVLIQKSELILSYPQIVISGSVLPPLGSPIVCPLAQYGRLTVGLTYQYTIIESQEVVRASLREPI